jgi:hypothetical protein
LAVILKKSPNSVRRRLASLKAKGAVMTRGTAQGIAREEQLWVPVL